MPAAPLGFALAVSSIGHARNGDVVKHLWDPQLSDREIHFVGMIFVQWGALEHEVFMQTLRTFEPRDGETDVPALPKEMNNLQFSGVLELWNERVVKARRGKRGKVLQQQYEEVVKLKEVRDGLTHGMWHWTPEDLGEIRTVRVRKREVITSRFSADVLGDVASRIGEINFNIRFPGGLVDVARQRMEEGGYMSRRAVAIFSGAPVDVEGFPTAHPRGSAASSEEADG
ncbi:MAG: hypothetical protein B7Y42_01690 [Polaromonas sp. 28-63-22]|nr:MAG: hypothetical protein B7Y42_01690 [Polaromonas sp. 28-63-22]